MNDDDDEDEVESGLIGRMIDLAVAGGAGRLTSLSMGVSHRHFYEERRAKWEQREKKVRKQPY